MIYNIVSKVIKALFPKTITFKKVLGTKQILHYEKAQHLTFLFKKDIDYEPKIREYIKAYISKDDLIFDIGANIGQYSLLYSEWVGCNGRVIAIEPDPVNFAFLQFNINRNTLTNVTALNIGVSDKENRMPFFRDSTTGGRRSSFIKENVGENYTGNVVMVDIRTIDFLIEEYGEPQFVKIDVEGFEVSVVCGLSKELKKTVFFIEVREETKTKIFEFFRERNYSCVLLERGTQVNTLLEIPSFANLLFIPETLINEE